MGEKFKFNRPTLYKFLHAYTWLAYRLYFRRITVVGYEKIPKNTPIIFAPNHQNALMDALAVVYGSRKRIAFLARADIFKKPAIAKILNMLQILPIYRIRDGFESLSNNQEVFDNTVAVLKSNIPLCILPEGNHEGQKRLRPLKKGIFRISFQAEESAANNLNLHIIPVGLDYSDYFNAGSDLVIVFGTPIKIADYTEQYRDNEPKTINTLMHKLGEGMRNGMIHIPEKHYELTHQISEMYEPNVWNTCNVKRHPYNKLTIKQFIVQKTTEAFTSHPEKVTEIGNPMELYQANINKLGLNDCLLQENPPGFILLLIETILSILLLPLHLYGLILNYLPYKILIKASSKVKDRHFQSSIQFGISLFLFPVYYLMLIALCFLLADNIFIKLLFSLTLPFTGFFTFYNHQHLKKLLGKLKIFYLRILKDEQYSSIINDRTNLINQIKATINN